MQRRKRRDRVKNRPIVSKLISGIRILWVQNKFVPEKMGESNASTFFLLLLVGQNTSKTLLLRAAVGGKPKFLYSAAVLATEGLKATLSTI